MTGKRSIIFMMIVEPTMISGMDSARPKPNSQGSPFDTAAMAMTLSRLIAASAIAIVPTARHNLSEAATACSSAVSPLRELDRDPQQQQSAEYFEELDLQQLRDDERENDPQRDGRAGAEYDADLALLGRQGPARKRDDHRIVAGQQQIDPDDLQDRKQGSGAEFHEWSVSVPYTPSGAVARGGQGPIAGR